MRNHTRTARKGNNIDVSSRDDWRTGFLVRRHRIPRALAVEYLNWALPRWEVKA